MSERERTYPVVPLHSHTPEPDMASLLCLTICSYASEWRKPEYWRAEESQRTNNNNFKINNFFSLFLPFPPRPCHCLTISGRGSCTGEFVRVEEASVLPFTFLPRMKYNGFYIFRSFRLMFVVYIMYIVDWVSLYEAVMLIEDNDIITRIYTYMGTHHITRLDVYVMYVNWNA